MKTYSIERGGAVYRSEREGGIQEFQTVSAMDTANQLFEEL